MPRKATEKKTAQMLLKMTPEVKEEIKQRAAERHLDVTDYMPRAGLGRAMRQRADVDAINALRECSDQLKQIYQLVQSVKDGHAIVPVSSMETMMAAITRTIMDVWTNREAAE